MRVCYTARRKCGLVAIYKRMQVDGMSLHAATEELGVSAANLSKWGVAGARRNQSPGQDP